MDLIKPGDTVYVRSGDMAVSTRSTGPFFEVPMFQRNYLPASGNVMTVLPYGELNGNVFMPYFPPGDIKMLFYRDQHAAVPLLDGCQDGGWRAGDQAPVVTTGEINEVITTDEIEENKATNNIGLYMYNRLMAKKSSLRNSNQTRTIMVPARNRSPRPSSRMCRRCLSASSVFLDAKSNRLVFKNADDDVIMERILSTRKLQHRRQLAAPPNQTLNFTTNPTSIISEMSADVVTDAQITITGGAVVGTPAPAITFVNSPNVFVTLDVFMQNTTVDRIVLNTPPNHSADQRFDQGQVHASGRRAGRDGRHSGEQHDRGQLRVHDAEQNTQVVRAGVSGAGPTSNPGSISPSTAPS